MMAAFDNPLQPTKELAKQVQTLTARYILAITQTTSPVQFVLHRNTDTGADILQLGKNDQSTKKLLILPWTSEIRWNNTPSIQITYTRSAAVVEQAGMRFREISISGDVGPMPQRWPGAADTETVAASVQAVEAISKWVERVLEDPSLVMQLYAVNEAQYWVVKPTAGMNISRSRGNRTGLHYDLTLRLIARVQPPTIVGHYWAVPSAKGWPKDLTAVTRAVKLAQAYVDASIDVVNSAKGWVDKNVLGPIDDLADGLGDISEGLVGLAADLERWTAGIIHRPLEWWGRMLRLSDSAVLLASACKRDFYDYFRKGGNFSPHDIKIGERIEKTSQMTAAIEAVDAATDAMNSALMIMATQFQADRGQYGYVPIRQGETLEALALRVLGTPDGVDTLIKLNGLKYPYISDSGEPGTRRPTQKILVPVQNLGTISSTIAAPTVTDPDDALLGVDLSMDSDGDLELTAGAFDIGEAADLELVRGEECFTQNLDARLHTVRGTNLLFIDSGLPVSIGQGATTERLADFATAAIQELRADDRVLAVPAFRLVTIGNQVGFEATLDLQNGQEVPATGGAA